jgi:membrane protease YdiL (CAAX protease family)/predicted negative regulator of RcsB-dependent stress response
LFGVNNIMPQSEANNYLDRANKLYQQEDYNEALKYYKKALNHFKELPDKTLEADTHLNLGNIYMELKKYPESLKHYNKSYQIYKKNKNRKGEGYSLTGMGINHERLEDHKKARNYYEQAAGKFQSINDTEKEGIVHSLIANTYQSQGDWEDAKIDYQKSTQIFHEIGDQDRITEIKTITQNIETKREKFKLTRLDVTSLIIYLLALIIAESTILFHNISFGLSLEAVILFILLIHSSLTKSTNLSILLRSMMALPIIRIIGLSIPLLQIPTLYWFPIIAIPLFATSYTIIKSQGLTRRNVGLIWGNLPLQLLIGSTGIILGSIEYIILQPKPLIATLNLETLLISSIILIISTGFAEELLFRGILQKNAQNVMGPLYGLLYTALLFTALHIGWNSIYDLIFVFAVGLFYGIAFYKTKSIIGTTLSHGISNTFLFLIVPFYAPLLYSIINNILQIL